MAAPLKGHTQFYLNTTLIVHIACNLVYIVEYKKTARFEITNNTVKSTDMAFKKYCNSKANTQTCQTNITVKYTNQLGFKERKKMQQCSSKLNLT